GEEWRYGEEINYDITQDTINALFKPLVAKGTMEQKRLDNVLRLFGHIQTRYGSDISGKNDEFITRELVPQFKNGGALGRESKYTIALDETDFSFIPFRAGGQSVLKRAITDIASVEENVSKPLMELVKKLRDMGINGKKDFGPIVEIIAKVHGALDGIIGIPYANELASKIASMTIMYMKKDTQARAFMGVLGVGRFNSMVAESAGRKVGVWEWDSADIDRFIVALESKGLVPPNPYSMGKDKTAREPIYMKIPFVKKPVKLPEKIELSKLGKLFGIHLKDIPLFQRRKYDFLGWTSKDLREKFGGTKLDMFFDILNKYLPAFIIFILIAQLKKAMDEAEGKKK
ncbi:MAG: hypothetical protein V1922_00335, partial [bacterium]